MNTSIREQPGSRAKPYQMNMDLYDIYISVVFFRNRSYFFVIIKFTPFQIIIW